MQHLLTFFLCCKESVGIVVNGANEVRSIAVESRTEMRDLHQASLHRSLPRSLIKCQGSF